MLVCEAPARASAGLVVASAEASGLGARFQYVEQAVARGVAPSAGVEEGGTVVAVAGTGLGDEAALSCALGSLAPVAARPRAPGECECVAPSHAVGSVAVAVGSSAAQWGSEGVAFRYGAGAHWLAAMPGSAAASGGSEVWVAGWVATSWAEAECWVEEAAGLAAASVGGVSCALPRARRPGFAVLAGGAGGGSVVLEVAEEGEVAGAVPGAAWQEGGGVVWLQGSRLSAAGERCLFGSVASVVGSASSSALVACEVPALAGGTVAVHAGGAQASAWDGGAARGAASLWLAPAGSVVRVAPDSGPVEGGTTAVVERSSGAACAACRFGTVAPVRARGGVSGSGLSECVSPAHEAGSVAVEAGAGGAEYTADGVAFVYKRAVQVVAVLPPAVPLAGGVGVTLFGWGLGGACRVGAHALGAVRASGGAMVCLAPAGAAGFVGVGAAGSDAQVGADAVLEYRDGAELRSVSGPGAEVRGGADVVVLEYRVGAELRSVVPGAVQRGSGAVVAVGGSGLDGGARCVMGSQAWGVAQYVSSALAVCELPADLTTGGRLLDLQQASVVSSGALTVTTYAAAAVADVSPAVGSAAGGTVVAAAGSGLAGTDETACRLCSVGPVAARWRSESSVECVSPAHAPGGVGVSAGASQAQSAWGGSVFRYAQAGGAVAGLPPSGAVLGGARVDVLGWGLLAASLEAACAFGEEATAGAAEIGRAHV